MNRRHLQSLIDNPPPTSPYFTLPSVNYIDIYTTHSGKFKYERKKAPNTITKIWGPVKKMTEENKVNFLTIILQYAKIDFDAMAKNKGIATGNQMCVTNLNVSSRVNTDNAFSKKRLNTIIKKEGYKLDGDQVVPTAVNGENQITKTTEITITEAVRDDTPESPLATTEENVTVPKVKKVTAKAAANVLKKRKRVDAKTPKEVLKKKQKKAVEQSMRESSA